MFHVFVDKLTQILHKQPNELGKEIQYRMAPKIRNDLIKNFDEKIAVKSAVLILVYPVNNKPMIVFMQRPGGDNPHSGQISFPGGKTEKTDKSIVATAIRETNEELGVKYELIEPISKLTELFIPVSNFAVTPVVACMYQQPEFIINPKEVDFVIEIPLSKLVQPDCLSTKVFHHGEVAFEAPVFKYNKHIIWGATAMMLNEFLYIIKSNNLQKYTEQYC